MMEAVESDLATLQQRIQQKLEPKFVLTAAGEESAPTPRFCRRKRRFALVFNPSNRPKFAASIQPAVNRHADLPNRHAASSGLPISRRYLS
jgi:hypothetical protein